MPSAYIQSGEYTAFGLPSTTTAADVQAASTLIDVYLKRPEGLVWSPDAAGAPCFMAGLTATLAFAAGGAISPGANIIVPVTGGFLSPDLVGDVLVIDAADPTKTEACIVSAIGAGTVTLQSVANAHISGALMETGRVILEERGLPANRAVTRISRSPVVRMLSVQGRYAYGRRSQQQAGVFYEPSILASVQAFGGPPVWNAINVGDVSVSQATGEVWVPPGILIANFSDVRMRYVAGYAAAAVPGPVKFACAQLVQQVQNFPEINGNIKRLQAGGTQIERFSDSLLDAETSARLDPFAAKLFY